VPTLVMYMLKLNEGRGQSQNLFVRFQKRFEKGFERLRNSYRRVLTDLTLTMFRTDSSRIRNLDHSERCLRTICAITQDVMFRAAGF